MSVEIHGIEGGGLACHDSSEKWPRCGKPAEFRLFWWSSRYGVDHPCAKPLCRRHAEFWAFDHGITLPGSAHPGAPTP